MIEINTVLNDKINTAANIDIIAINLVVPIFVDNQNTTKILYNIDPQHKQVGIITNLYKDRYILKTNIHKKLFFFLKAKKSILFKSFNLDFTVGVDL